jgi:hypothetical protein
MVVLDTYEHRFSKLRPGGVSHNDLHDYRDAQAKESLATVARVQAPLISTTMQREIKFRAWEKSLKRWHEDIGFNVDSVFNNEGAYIGPRDNFDIVQFTGLKDKNGKEIYEADIVDCKAMDNYPEDNVPKRVFFGKDLGFVTSAEVANHGLPLTWGGYKSLEIIGNIYESPDLLKA